jgi:hypothetical protein
MNATTKMMKNMKCLVAEYRQTTTFKLPLGLDLENKNIVEEYWVKWNTLTIKLENGETLIIAGSDCEDDKKHPEETRLEDAEDWGIEYDEDEKPAYHICEYCEDNLVDETNGKNVCEECYEDNLVRRCDHCDCIEVKDIEGEFQDIVEEEDGTHICESCIEEKEEEEEEEDEEPEEKPKEEPKEEPCIESEESDTESEDSDTPSDKSNQEEHNANNEGYDQFPERRVEGQQYYINEENNTYGVGYTYTYDKQNDWWSKHPNERLKDAYKALALRNTEDLAFGSGILHRPHYKDNEDDCCMSCGVQESYRNFCDDCRDIRNREYVRDDGLTDEEYKDGLKDVMMPLRNTINEIEDAIDGWMTYEEGERNIEDLAFWEDIADRVMKRKLINRQ